MKSMTGFGRGAATSSDWQCRVEISSVNRKQLDLVIALPRELAVMEREVRQYLGEKLSRGRVNAKISVESNQGAGFGRLRCDEDLARQYVRAHQKLGESLGQQLAPLDLVRAPGVFEIEEQELDTEALWAVMKEALEAAFSSFSQMREAEGKHLATVLLASLERLENLASQIREQAPKVVETYRRNLSRRLEEAGLPLPLDDERLLKEIGFFAERCDITEELERLGSHFRQTWVYLNSAEPVGRSLDFLAQELYREFNTIGSKANDAALAQAVIEAKTEVEKIREQVQNLE